jgi:hypothetical protein
MGLRREALVFAGVLASCVAAFFNETLFGGKVLSPADVLLVSGTFRGDGAADYEPENRLLMDPVLQFQPWLEFNRRMIRSGRLPLWNSYAGCGTPHLANGQSAVFDPFHLLAYFGSTPQAYAWIAACRLWTAGFGMFLLARAWGLRGYGRWFAALVFPFSGFLIVWLLYPVTPVAIWLPWLLFTTHRLIEAPTLRAAGWLALVVALVTVGGHIQTSAHVLLLGGVYTVMQFWWQWRRCPSAGTKARTTDSEGRTAGLLKQTPGLAGTEARPADLLRQCTRPTGTAARPTDSGTSPNKWFGFWIVGTVLGLGLASAQILPLGFYLAKSSVWADRRSERPPWWAMARPRLLEAVCTAAPYVYGSKRRGHPNLAKALGVENLNESAGGFAGLASLIWLAPLAVLARRRDRRIVCLAATTVFGAMAAFQLPPVDNLLRALPVLGVTDNRRLTLWVAFGLSLLGGAGLDQLGKSHRLPRFWISLWLVAAGLFAAGAGALPAFEHSLRDRAQVHYRAAALATPGADLFEYQSRGERQVARTMHFLPRYYGLIGGELLTLTAGAALLRKRRRTRAWIRPAILLLTLGELALFGFGLNPAIAATVHGFEPPFVARLRQALPPEARALGVGEELPPNTLMRFQLSDPRNYDSVELARSVSWLRPLYEPERGASALSSRSEVNWNGVVRARERLRESGVAAIVASTTPPSGEFASTERVGRAWIAWLEAKRYASSTAPHARVNYVRDHGKAEIAVDSPTRTEVIVRETWDPGWQARVDGKRAILRPKWGVFLSLDISEGHHKIALEYDPAEVRTALAISSGSAVLLILVLTGIRKL